LTTINFTATLVIGGVDVTGLVTSRISAYGAVSAALVVWRIDSFFDGWVVISVGHFLNLLEKFGV